MRCLYIFLARFTSLEIDNAVVCLSFAVNMVMFGNFVIINMRQVQPKTLPKNSNFSSCLQNIKLKNNHLKLQTPDSFRIRYRTLFHFYLKKNRLEFRFRSHDFSFNLFPVWQPLCWRFWSAIVPIHTSTINEPKKGVYYNVEF